jgi:predicted TPR repeat methyltransferase
MTFDSDRLAAAYARARALEDAGELAAAAAAYAEVLALDPDDFTGSALRLAAIGGSAVPERASEAYVAALFDQHAGMFEAILVDRLGYRVPWLIGERLAMLGHAGARRLLDLGCGTGLVGEVLAETAAHASGVDLSEDMLAIADAKGVYDELYVGDAVRFLAITADPAEAGAGDGGSSSTEPNTVESGGRGSAAAEPGDPEPGATEPRTAAPEAAEPDGADAPWDLVVAADVVPYLGALDALFAGVARNSPSGGLFAFSTETPPEAALTGRAYIVGPHQRFAHAADYIRRELARHGFAIAWSEPITVRSEEGRPVAGELVIARRS